VLPAEAIRLGRRVRRLESTDGRFVVFPETGHPIIEARVVVLATPAFATASIVRT
jgi:hypothetical protein